MAWVLLGVHLLWRCVRWVQGFPIWGDEAFVAVNFWDRGYAELVRPLEYGQIGPLLWLWLEKAMFDLFGPWERALRLPAFFGGIGAALLFFRLAFQLLPTRAAVLGFAVFAASYYPVRHGAELKPYSTDLLVALAMYSLCWDWLRDAACARWKKRTLVALTVLGPWISLPSMFVAGSCLTLLFLHDRRRAPMRYAAWAVALGASALWMVAAFAGPHAESAAWLKEMAMWTPTFPPLAEPWKLPLWWLERHCGYMAAYPTGGRDWGSTLSFLLMVGGAVVWWRSGKRVAASGAAEQDRAGLRMALALLTLPLAFNFLAAALERYPYGGSVRVSLYFAPAACLLMGSGLDALAARLGRRRDQPLLATPLRDRVRLALCAVLLLFAASGVVRDIVQPHKLHADRRAAEFAAQLGEEVRPGDRVLGYVWMREPGVPGFFEQGGSLARLRFQLRRELPAVDVEWDAPSPAADERRGEGAVWIFGYADDNQTDTPFPQQDFDFWRRAWRAARPSIGSTEEIVFGGTEKVFLIRLP